MSSCEGGSCKRSVSCEKGDCKKDKSCCGGSYGGGHESGHGGSWGDGGNGSMSHHGQYEDGCRRHKNQQSCDKCSHKKMGEAWKYPDKYSHWESRKEKCKPVACPKKSFQYNGVYFSRRCCPPLTDWIEVLEAPPNDLIIVEAEEP